MLEINYRLFIYNTVIVIMTEAAGVGNWIWSESQWPWRCRARCMTSQVCETDVCFQSSTSAGEGGAPTALAQVSQHGFLITIVFVSSPNVFIMAMNDMSQKAHIWPSIFPLFNTAITLMYTWNLWLTAEQTWEYIIVFSEVSQSSHASMTSASLLKWFYWAGFKIFWKKKKVS